MPMPSPSMALSASAVLLASTPKLQIRLSERQLSNVCHQVYPKCTSKVIMANISEPHKLKGQLRNVRDRLWEDVPDSVKQFPWKKAENILLKRLLFLGQKALKWSLVALFVFSSLTDIVVSISRNQELMIPFGLLIGYLMTDFLRETLREVFHGSEGMGLRTQFLSISCFLVLVKFASASFAMKGQVFLLHVANGGLMQVLWLWKYLSEENDKRSEENCVSHQDASLAIDAED